MLSDDLLEELAWLDDAACTHADVAYSEFFPKDGRALSRDVKELCWGCPVRRQCIDHAKRLNLSEGWFGGVAPKQRRGATTEQLLEL